MIDCVIIEDEPLARKLLETYVSKMPVLRLVKSFSDSLEALTYLQDHRVDLLFLDIQMPDLTGMSLLKLMSYKPQVILTTAYSEYALDGYSLDVTDYLLKPIIFERFFQAVEKVKQRLSITSTAQVPNHVVPEESNNKDDIIFVKDGTKLVRIDINSILYIEGLKDYVSIYIPNHKIVSLQRMKRAGLSASIILISSHYKRYKRSIKIMSRSMVYLFRLEKPTERHLGNMSTLRNC